MIMKRFPRCAFVLAFAVALALPAVTLTGCSKGDNKPPEKGPIEVTVMSVTRGDVPVAAVYVAQTQSVQAVNIQARVSGWLDKRTYVEGSVVKTGQVMFQMDQKPFQAQVDSAKAALERQQAAALVAKQNLDRTKPLTEQNALSQKDLDDATGQFEQTQAAVAQAQAELETAQLNLSYTTIRSPVDGVSSYAQVADGTYLNPQNAQLTTVSVLTPMWINFSVSENEFQRVRNEVRAGHLKLPEGGRFVVEVEMVDGHLFPYTGTITFADPSYNSNTGTFLLRATVNNPAGILRPNQYVRIRVTGAIRPNAIVVPQRSVQQSGKGQFVWVIDAESHAQPRPVLVGDWKGDGWLITDGLNTGDKVVVDGVVRLTPGAPVKEAPYVPPATTAATEKPQAEAPPFPAATPSSVHVYFAKGQSTLDSDARRAVRIGAAAYIGIGTKIVITGYADKSGNVAANVELAKKRAEAVRDELVQFGVERARIQLVPPVNVTGGDDDQLARRVDVTMKQ